MGRCSELPSPKSSVGLTLWWGPLGLIQLQKNKEQEEQLGEMIQAYEKLCVEKSDLETELGEMVRPGEPGVLEDVVLDCAGCVCACVHLVLCVRIPACDSVQSHVSHTTCMCPACVHVYL